MKKSGGVIGKILLAIVILAVVVLAVSGVVGSILNRGQEDASFHADLEGYEGAEFIPAGKGFAALSEVAVRLYGENGEVLCSAAHSYPNGVAAASTTAAVVWTPGGTELSILHSSGECVDLSFSGGVTAADVNDGGYAVVLAGEKGYKGSVSVILPDGEAAYRVYLGSGYPVDADLSPDSRQIAILSLTAEGSRVSIYSTDREEPQSEWTGPDVYFELEYLPGGRICLISADRVMLLTADGKAAGEYAYPDDFLKDYALTGDNGIVLALGKYQTGTAGRLAVLDSSGNQSAGLALSAEVASISAAGKYIAVRYSDEITVYDMGLNPVNSLSGASGTQAAFMRADGSAIIISGGGAAIFES